MKAITAKIISPYLRLIILGLATFSLQLISDVHAVETGGLSPSLFIHSATSPPQSDKYPKANPILQREGYALFYGGRS